MAVRMNDREEIDELKRLNPMDRVVESYGITLKPQGRQALIGHCPFHDGRSPKLYVYTETASWYCYHCSVGGDVFKFVMLREDIPFSGAKRLLREWAGRWPAPTVETRRPAPERQWDRLTLEEQLVMNTALSVYQDALSRTPEALEYIWGRGIPDEIVHECRLGYADGHSLEEALGDRSLLKVGERLGLIRKSRGTEKPKARREFFAGRIVVPELRGGNCIWLIGRSLKAGNGGGPKYLALGGERPVLGYERAVGQPEAYLCEGIFDWLTAVSWGLPAFSPCGTSLPSKRLGFLAQAAAIYGVLDGDEAGQAAAVRFGEQLGDRFRPILLPDGLDLNDLGEKPDGKDAFLRLVAQAGSDRQKVSNQLA